MSKKPQNHPQNRPSPLSSHRVNLTLPDEVYRWLRKKAAILGKSPTTYASMVLMQMMMDEKTNR